MRAKAVVDAIEVLMGLAAPPRRLLDVIATVLIENFHQSDIAAAERAESLIRAVASLIRERAIAAENDGTFATLSLAGDAEDVVAGACHVFPSDTDLVSNFKQGRQHVGSLLAAIRALNFDQFEHFGARVLVELGATSARITPQTGDQGIDFFGKLNLGELQGHPLPFLKLAHDVKLSFVGQAKHYPDRPLGPNTVRELAGAVSLARAGAFSSDELDLFDDLDLSAYFPVVTLLFTTGRLTSGAIRLAASAGIIARSGEQMAVFLAEKGVGIVEHEGAKRFEQGAFLSWLSAD